VFIYGRKGKAAPEETKERKHQGMEDSSAG
jgi:hypothetical protein